jgi:hypothetical protein
MARVGIFPRLGCCADHVGYQPDAWAPILIRHCIGCHDVGICIGVLHQGRATVWPVQKNLVALLPARDLTIGWSDRGSHLRRAREGVDDWDKSASLVVGEGPRRPTSSLSGAVNNNSENSVKHVPDQVITAILLLGVQSFLVTLNQALRMDWLYRQQAQLKVAFLVAVSALFLFGLYRRLNWLRWIVIAYTALQVVAMPVALPKIHDAAQLVLTCAAVISGIAASVLFCMPTARRWYE